MARPLLDPKSVDRALAGTAWARHDDAIVAVHQAADFRQALEFVNRVGELAEAANHHPDIAINWNRVTLTLSTHSAGGLTAADFALARQISALT